MRLLHDIHETECIVSTGSYDYIRAGFPTGQKELWQISELPDGSQIVRADITGQDASKGPEVLCHLIRHPNGRPNWLRLRFESPTATAAAQYTFDTAEVQIARQAEGYGRRQEKLEIASNFEVDYHPVIAHDYVWRGYPAHARGKEWMMPVFSPALFADEPSEALSGRSLRFSVRPVEVEELDLGIEGVKADRQFNVTLSDGVKAMVWFDEHGVPLRWYYPDKDYDFVLTAYERLD